MEKDLVKPKEIAYRLGIPVGTVYSWIGRGQLGEPDVRMGRFVFWEWRNVQERLEFRASPK